MSTGSGEGPGRSGGKGVSGPIPERIDRYRIRRIIGTGGQGTVYHAYDPNLQIEVALKVVHRDLRTEEFVDRFAIEARTAVQLAAPNVVRVYNFDPQYPFLAMEYCGDGDLNQYIKVRRRRSLAELLGLMRQVAEALVAAHENEPPILHRDLKPSNVLFKKNVVKVADFGLAKVLGSGSGVTTTRGIMGTVRYMSPEQLRDPSKVDARTDLWALGVIFYELLTWARPFDRSADSFVNVAVRIHTEPPAPLPYSLPAPVAAFLERALEKNVERRFSSAREMIAAIDSMGDEVPQLDQLLLPPEEYVDERSRMAQSVAELVEQGQSVEASTLARELRRSAPDDSLGRYWESRIRENRSDGEPRHPSDGDYPGFQLEAGLQRQFASIQSLVDSHDYSEALRKLYEILRENPGNTVALRLVERVRDGERRLRLEIDEAHRQADRLREAGDHADVCELWEGLKRDYPGILEVEANLEIAKGEARAARLRADRAGVLEAAQGARARGDLTAALGLCESHLHDDPGAEQVAAFALRIHQEQAERECTARFAATLAIVERRLGEDDCDGALVELERFLHDYPTHAEASERLAAVRARVEELERSAALEELAIRVEQLARCSKSGRFQGLGDVDRAVRAALGAAREATGRGRDEIARLAAALSTAQETAEVRLREECAARRSALLERLRSAQDEIGTDDAEGGEQLERLRVAAATALAALCRADQGDPLAALDTAAKGLTLAREALVRHRENELRGARSATMHTFERARLAAAAIAAGCPSEATVLEGRLQALAPAIGAASPARSVAIRGELESIEAAADSTRLSRLAGECDELSRLSERALRHATAPSANRLREKIRRTGRLLGGPEASNPEAAPALSAALAELRLELDGVEPGDTRRVAEARADERLATRERVTECLAAHADAVAEVEGPVDADGLALEAASGSAAELLGRYRRAVSRMDEDELRALGQRLEEFRRSRSRERGDTRRPVPQLGSAARRLNRRYAGPLLERFDALSTRHADALSEGRSGEAVRLQAELEREHERLLRPAPPWRRALVPAVVLLACAVPAAALWLARSDERGHSVTVVSAEGRQHVRAVRKAGSGEPLTTLVLDVDEEGRIWEDLAPGTYEAELDGVPSISFRVPGSEIVLPPRDDLLQGLLSAAQEAPEP